MVVVGLARELLGPREGRPGHNKINNNSNNNNNNNNHSKAGAAHFCRRDDGEIDV